MTEAEAALFVGIFALVGVVLNAIYTHFATSKVGQERIRGELKVQIFERASGSMTETMHVASEAYDTLEKFGVLAMSGKHEDEKRSAEKALRASINTLAKVGTFLPPTLDQPLDAFRITVPEVARRAAFAAVGESETDILAEAFGSLNYFRSKAIRWRRAVWKELAGNEPVLEPDDPNTDCIAPQAWIDAARRRLREINDGDSA